MRLSFPIRLRRSAFGRALLCAPILVLCRGRCLRRRRDRATAHRHAGRDRDACRAPACWRSCPRAGETHIRTVNQYGSDFRDLSEIRDASEPVSQLVAGLQADRLHVAARRAGGRVGDEPGRQRPAPADDGPGRGRIPCLVAGRQPDRLRVEPRRQRRDLRDERRRQRGDAPDQRPGGRRLPELVAGRVSHHVRVEPQRQLRHLGDERGRLWPAGDRDGRRRKT